MMPPGDWPNRGLSRSVRLGPLDWHVQEAGEGPVVLLLHGTGAATHSWRDVLPRLAERFRVIAPDLPGHGFTHGTLRGGPTLPNVARAVAELVADTPPELIVGHSAGAAIGAQMILGGAAARGLVALAPAMLPFPGVAQAIFPTMAKLLFVNPFAPHLFAGIARGPGAVERFLARSTGSTIDAAGIAAYTRLFGDARHCAGTLGMMAAWDLVPVKAGLSRLSLPVAIVHGDRDSAIPVAAARETAQLIRGATLDVRPGLGHLLHEEAPAEVSTAIVRQWESVQ